MKKLFAVLASIALAAGMLVAGEVPAQAITSTCTDGVTCKQHAIQQVYRTDGAYYYEAAATLTITEPITASYTQSTAHWVGIDGAGYGSHGSYLVQAGFKWKEINGGSMHLQVWDEFAGQSYEQQLYDTSGTCVKIDGHSTEPCQLTFAPHAGDTLYFHLWYHDVNSWGLTIHDNNRSCSPITNCEWSHYIYPATGTAGLFLNPYAEIDTENHCSSGEQLLHDGVETFKQPQAAISGGSMVLFENEQNSNTTNMYDGSTPEQEMESAAATNSNGYAYHTFERTFCS